MVLLAIGGVLFVLGLALPGWMVVLMPVGGFVLLGGMVLWAIMALDHYLRVASGRPPARYSTSPPPTYTCPTYGYRLRGVRGVFCPECGTVRPVALDDDDE